MRSRKLVLFGLLFMMAPWTGAQVPSLTGREPYVPGEVLVRFKDQVTAQERSKILGMVGNARPQIHPLFQKVRLTGGSVEDAVRRLKARPEVLDAQPNFRYYAFGSCSAPASDVYDAGLTTAASWPFLKIQMDKAITLFGGWTSCSPPWGSASVTVAVMDSGISRLHPDLHNIPLIGYNAICDTRGEAPSCSCGGASTESAGVTTAQDDFGHGTYVAGIIGGDWGTSNLEGACSVGPTYTSGIVGIAPGVVLMPVKVLDCTGSGTTDAVVAGTYYAVDHGARILNFSLGSSASGGLDPLEQAALDYALAHDCVIVASSGNESSPNGLVDVDFPAAYPPVLAVGASDPNDQRVFYSNGGSNLDLLAPGGTGTAFSGNALTDSAYKIFSAFLCPLSSAAVSEGGFEPLSSDHNFGVAAGTSASAPFVTGAAALIRSVYPSLTHVQVEQAILNNTDSLNSNQGWDAKTGYGRLNVYKALLNAGSGSGQLTSYVKTFNSPNPFYPDIDGTTNITLALSQAVPVDLSIYDSAGELVFKKSFGATELNQNPSRPQFKSFYVPWDGKNGNGQTVMTGIYFYFVTVDGQTGHNKIALIRGSK